MNKAYKFYKKVFKNLKFIKKKTPLKRKPRRIKVLISFINKYVKRKKMKNNFYFLRKNKSFIKNKYPRNRQWSKNIIYFGVWLNIVLVYFSYIFCYHYSFILNYIWWLTLILFYFISLRSILTFNIIKNWVISIIKLYISFRIKKKDKDKNKDKHAY